MVPLHGHHLRPPLLSRLTESNEEGEEEAGTAEGIANLSLVPLPSTTATEEPVANLAKLVNTAEAAEGKASHRTRQAARRCSSSSSGIFRNFVHLITGGVENHRRVSADLTSMANKLNDDILTMPTEPSTGRKKAANRRCSMPVGLLSSIPSSLSNSFHIKFTRNRKQSYDVLRAFLASSKLMDDSETANSSSLIDTTTATSSATYEGDDHKHGKTSTANKSHFEDSENLSLQSAIRQTDRTTEFKNISKATLPLALARPRTSSITTRVPDSTSSITASPTVQGTIAKSKVRRIFATSSHPDNSKGVNKDWRNSLLARNLTFSGLRTTQTQRNSAKKDSSSAVGGSESNKNDSSLRSASFSLPSIKDSLTDPTGQNSYNFRLQQTNQPNGSRQLLLNIDGVTTLSSTESVALNSPLHQLYFFDQNGEKVSLPKTVQTEITPQQKELQSKESTCSGPKPNFFSRIFTSPGTDSTTPTPVVASGNKGNFHYYSNKLQKRSVLTERQEPKFKQLSTAAEQSVLPPLTNRAEQPGNSSSCNENYVPSSKVRQEVCTNPNFSGNSSKRRSRIHSTCSSSSSGDNRTSPDTSASENKLKKKVRRRHHHHQSLSRPFTTCKFESGENNVDTDPSSSLRSQQNPQPKKTAANNSSLGTPSSNTAITHHHRRRHTIPDIMTASAASMVLCGSEEEHRYRGRIEKVKFGVPIHEAFAHDIPATLLVLLLKLNKEGPLKKDIWRAPGHEAQVRKLIAIMAHGRLVNISNISVHNAASIVKKFLSKLPGGILGQQNERQLFEMVESQPAEDIDLLRQLFCRVISSLPVPSQHLLVLLFGTFRVIVDMADTFGTRMNANAIGISVAPALFHTCVSDGHRAKMEDVNRFKLASQVISKVIQSFGYTNLFPRECYEFYARITGRQLRFDDQWQFTFTYPSRALSQPSVEAMGSSPLKLLSREAIVTDGQSDAPGTSARHHIDKTTITREDQLQVIEDEEVCDESLPELASVSAASVARYRRHRDQSRSLDEGTIPGGILRRRSDVVTPVERQRQKLQHRMEQQPLHEERLSMSMGEVVVHSADEGEHFAMIDHEYRAFERSHRSLVADSTLSLSHLEWVHECQTRRMKTRSEWFLSPPPTTTVDTSESVLPPKNGNASRSFDFHGEETQLLTVRAPSSTPSQHSRISSISPMPQSHLARCLFKQDEEPLLVTSSGDEEMLSVPHSSPSISAAGPSYRNGNNKNLNGKRCGGTMEHCSSSCGQQPHCCPSSSSPGSSSGGGMKCSPLLFLRPDSQCTTSESGAPASCESDDVPMRSQPTTEAESSEDDDAFLPPLPSPTNTFQLAQHQQPLQSPNAVGGSFVRQPFQLLQERQYSSSTDATESASVTPSATTGGGSQQEIFGAGSSKTIQHFFGSTDFYEGGLLHVLPEQLESESGSPQPPRLKHPADNNTDIPPGVGNDERRGSLGIPIGSQQQRHPLIRSTISSSTSSGGNGGNGAENGGGGSGTGSGGSVATALDVPLAQSQQQQQQLCKLKRVSSGNGAGGVVVRRRSWRKHYMRPKNKSLEYESANHGREDLATTSHSTPIRWSISSLRRNSSSTTTSGSNSGGGNGRGGSIEDSTLKTLSHQPQQQSSSSVAALVRRRSSGNGGNGGSGVGGHGTALGGAGGSKIPVQTRRSTQT